MEQSLGHADSITPVSGLTFEAVWAALMENREQMKETDRQLKEQLKETDRQLKEQMKETAKQISKLGNRFGELAEHLVSPNIKEKFNRLGFNFTKCSTNVKIAELDDPNVTAELDILLENGDIAIAVEVKARPDTEDVKEHVERLQKLRQYADRRGDKRKYRGAIAAAIINDGMRRHIIKQGFYLIEQTGDTVTIHIPEGFVPAEW